ncbi:MAG: arsenosugar biosynthesis radical SAM protein ArsS [Chromatiales bacterium]|nr:arsenosugar biosynthesis radical SAM protein ArsS [Chromatiales bacterium]
MHDVRPRLFPTRFAPLARERIDTLQVNLSYRCNQQCVHCHVNAGPKRTEAMDNATVGQVLAVLERRGIATLDLTGGAPELHPRFRDLVRHARERGVHVIDRCNLTVLEEPDQTDTAEFLAHHRVEIIASLPCYLEDNVDRQRGKGVFEKSLRVLRHLNELGYADETSGLYLNLVYNPQGPVLPPPQCGLESDYKRELDARYGIRFNRLYSLANMPIARFGSTLISKGVFDEYLGLLRAAHRDENRAGVMCRNLVSVDWRGRLYDCDFNQMLDLPLARDGRARSLADLLDDDLAGAPIAVAEHCFGCTAGQGSSCGGALDG